MKYSTNSGVIGTMGTARKGGSVSSLEKTAKRRFVVQEQLGHYVDKAPSPRSDEATFQSMMGEQITRSPLHS